jgi:hypothetical protein
MMVKVSIVRQVSYTDANSPQTLTSSMQGSSPGWRPPERCIIHPRAIVGLWIGLCLLSTRWYLNYAALCATWWKWPLPFSSSTTMASVRGMTTQPWRKSELNQLTRCKVFANNIRLPFQEDWSDGLGIIVKNYLDTAPPVGDKKLQEACMAKTDSYFMHADVPASYKDAFQLWTAVAEGVKGSDSLIDAKTKEKWEKANGWVSARSANFLS